MESPLLPSNILSDVRAKWEAHSDTDPFWAILSDPSKKGELWTPEDFYAKGRHDFNQAVKPVLDRFPSLEYRRALDFGCGAGRLSFPLAEVFDEVACVDIAQGMLSLAERHDSSDGRCRFVHNEQVNLDFFADETFDFIYCHIVLQHLRPEHSRAYLLEFIRVMRGGGLGFVQIPEIPAVNSAAPESRVELHGLTRSEVEDLLVESGCEIKEIADDGWCGPAVRSWRYVFEKKLNVARWRVRKSREPIPTAGPPKVRRSMNTQDLRKKWELLGENDPLWAILTDESKKGNKWDLEHFFETGRRDCEASVMRALSINPDLTWGTALDFGCGVGRLTQGLAAFFKSVVGVDISEPMIRQANELNRAPEKVSYRLNTTDDLSQFPDDHFDHIISYIVLQHVPVDIHRRYVAEFVRILKPGGMLLFQLPEPFGEDWGGTTFNPEDEDKIDMYGSPQEEVLRILQDAGGRILQVKEDGACGPEHVSYRFVATKCAPVRDPLK